MINPSDICLDTLPWVPLRATNGFPRDPAIYFAIDSQGVVQYVGQTDDVRGRWGAVTLGVSCATIFNWESGRSEPHLNPEQYLALCRLYECSLKELADASAETVRLASAASNATLNTENY